MSDISARLATELNAQQQQVVAATKLLDEGATVPFIARYRKEVTGGSIPLAACFTCDCHALSVCSKVIGIASIK